MTIAGSVSLTGALNNDGTIDQTAGPFRVDAGALATNEPGGTYNIEFDGQFLNGSGSGTLENQGTIVKTTGTGVSSVDQFFVNDGGTIVAQSGSLDLDFATYEGTSTFTADQGALIDLGFTQSGGVAGDGTITGTMTGSGAGTVQLSQAVTIGTAGATLDFPGNLFQWAGGATTVSAGGTLTNQAGATLTIAASVRLLGTLNNDGTIDQTAGPFDVNVVRWRSTKSAAPITSSSTACSSMDRATARWKTRDARQDHRYRRLNRRSVLRERRRDDRGRFGQPGPRLCHLRREQHVH